MQIDSKTLAELLQLGGKYFLPAAALLRALYAGIRGKLPEGFAQIAVTGLFAGLAAAVGSTQLDIRSVALEILGNTFFTVGLLSFILVYLLRMENRGLVVDGIVGGIIGLISWAVLIYILQEPWPWWTIFLIVPAGAAAFVALRFALRQIMRVVRIATYLIVIGLVLVIGAGGFLLFQTLTRGA
jgi:hypothetical protein